MTTLFEYWEAERDKAKDRVEDDLAPDVSAIAAELKLETGLADWYGKSVSKLNREAEVLRKKLPGASGARRDEINDALHEAERSIRARTALQDEHARSAVALKIRLARAVDRLDRGRRYLGEAEKEHAQWKKDQEEVRDEKWATQFAQPPLADLAAAADEVLGGDAYTDFKAAVEGLLPAKLRQLAGARRSLVAARSFLPAGRVAHALGRLANEIGKDGFDVRREQKRETWEEARADLVAFKDGVTGRLSAAREFLGTPLLELDGRKLMAEHAKPVDDEDPEEVKQAKQALARLKADLNDFPDAEATAADAVDKETARVAAEEELLKARTALGKQEFLDSIGQNADVPAAQQAVDAAKQAAEDAAGEVTAALQDVLDQWEEIVPDGLWESYLGFLRVTDDLNRLKGETVQAYLNAFLDAEDKFVAAIEKAHEAGSKRRDIRNEVVARQSEAQAAEERAGAAMFSLVRGDSFDEGDKIPADELQDLKNELGL